MLDFFNTQIAPLNKKLGEMLYSKQPKRINVKYIDPSNTMVVIDWRGKKQIVVLPEAGEQDLLPSLI